MAMRAAPAKTAHPAAKKAAPAKKASSAQSATPANHNAAKPAAARKRAAQVAPKPTSDADLTAQFDATLQHVRQRNKQLTNDLDALLAALK